MSRKHFIKIAKIIARVEDIRVREYLASEFCDLCRAENPNFDKLRFLRACGVSA